MNACASDPAAPRDIHELAQPDRVHSRAFTDARIFDEEIAKIFGKTWVFALHESEIPTPGDFKTFTLGKTPVIAVRTKERKLALLVNRCRHRGAQICEQSRGNASRFQCAYHGWTYAIDGRLISRVEGTSHAGEEVGLASVPRVSEYRGFVFASFSNDGPTLEEYLGATRGFIDIVVDYSPTGRIRVLPGIVHKYRFRGNWKQVGMDGYHVHFVHASVVDLFAKRKGSTGSAVGALQIEDPWSDSSSSRSRGFAFGHAALDLRVQRLHHGENFMKEVARAPGGRDYIATMLAKHGYQRALAIIALHGDPHLGVFPNLQLIHDHLRVVVPISVSETHVYMYPIFLEDVPEEFNIGRLRHHEDFYGPASFGSPDDVELFERTQLGLDGEVNPWIMINRGLERESTDHDGTTVGLISDEVTQRAQMREWKRLMAL